MQPTGGLDNPTDLPRLQSKRSILEFLLHISRAKVTQIASFPRTTTITFTLRQLPQANLSTVDLFLMALDNRPCLVPGPRNLRLPPGTRTARVSVLDQQVAGPDLPFIVAVAAV
jgi:hypothetical protein